MFYVPCRFMAEDQAAQTVPLFYFFFYLENKEKTGRMKTRPCGLMRPTSQPWNRAAHCFIISQIYTLSNITNKQQHTTTHNITGPSGIKIVAVVF